MVILVALVLFLCAVQILAMLRGTARDKAIADMQSQVTAFSAKTESQLQSISGQSERTERTLREEVARLREESALHLTRLSDTNDKKLAEIRAELEAKLKAMLDGERAGREEEAATLKRLQDAVSSRISELSTTQKAQLDSFAKQIAALSDGNERRLIEMRLTIEARLKELQAGVDSRLETMRATVDEKLQTTLERRLGESFKLVSDRLESVQRGLGEMQVLASNVGDLKKVLANVSTRGGWGEVKLASLLEQILAPEQYGADVQTKAGSSGKVEFAIKLPGKDEYRETTVWLPIDAKFPLDVYQRAAAAIDSGDTSAMETTCAELEANIVASAKSIRDKYLDPPGTTDFAIMFLPVEGLYAEVLRRPGLAEVLQRKYHVIVAGPTTLAAILNSLQMGFRTLAITKRSSEVWQLLGAIKTEFGYFGDVLSKVQKKLQEASNTIEGAETRTRVIQRKLRSVQELPASEAAALLPGEGAAEGESEPEEPPTT